MTKAIRRILGRRVQIDQIDAALFDALAQHPQIVTVIQMVH